MARQVREPHSPQQERSRFLADAVLQAAARVVRDVGWSRAKVSRIAQVAGVSVGSLYRYFPGRDVLLRAIIDRALRADTEAFNAALERVHGNTVQESLEAFADAMLAEGALTHPNLVRHLVGLLETADRQQAVQQTFDQMVRRFAEHLVALHPELGDLALVERRCHIAFWAIRAAFLARARVEETLDLGALRDDVLRMALALLKPSVSGEPASSSQQ